MLVRDQNVVQHTLLFCAVVAVSAGCQNKNGALVLVLEPTNESFRKDEPIVVSAIFTSKEGAVCIDKPVDSSFDGELRSLDSDTTFDKQGIAHCGMVGLLLVPAIPVMYAYSALDVADTTNRYRLVSEAKPVTYRFIVLADKERFRMAPLGDPSSSRDNGEYKLAPGRYQLDLTFQCNKKSAYPRPMFWNSYTGQVHATTEFAILEN